MIDPPAVPSRGRLWSHLASDTSYDELHAFARELGIPERGFDRDHYDVPGEWYDAVLELGVEPVSSRELVKRLVASGLRRRKPEFKMELKAESKAESKAELEAGSPRQGG